jgi:hypothetical protein
MRGEGFRIPDTAGKELEVRAADGMSAALNSSVFDHSVQRLRSETALKLRIFAAQRSIKLSSA